MKKFLKSANLPALTMAAGGIGLLLRVWLLRSGETGENSPAV